MTVEVSFLRPFSADSVYLSNVLVVSVRVTDLGHTQGCTAFVATVTADGGGDVASDRVAGSDNTVRTHVYNVQRLRGALYLQLQINYVMRDQSRHSIGGWIDAGLPLVASASLWKQADSRGVQSECSEDEIHSST
ncbi:PREDICTED: uncharacterized protein LOC106817782 [Priapulus caudatus]|uniref:Uncharacterized protein LOC106817782 n=1 Tax=Priapulus caudatus TaxID=37621 RepID=A0ABM1F0J7_PRICU|nr:PREDICTED: uncharacterized protein LOC106817782 [Priapulus caudatus]